MNKAMQLKDKIKNLALKNYIPHHRLESGRAITPVPSGRVV